MNYRHAFHAGNFADVFKHSILILLLEYMQKKEKGFCYIDTHAGSGLYDFRSIEARRNPEYLEGVIKFLRANPAIDEFKTYIELLKPFNARNMLSFYPGSPLIARHLLRPQDCLILNELHPEEFQKLKKSVGIQANIHYHQRNAYEFLPAVLPPVLKRALILMDPPYEKTDEYSQLFNVLNKAFKHFPSGVYAVWYPIKSHQHKYFIDKCIKQNFAELLVAEWVLNKDFANATDLVGCGMLMFNPPWQIDKKIADMMKAFQDIFDSQRQGAVNLFSYSKQN